MLFAGGVHDARSAAMVAAMAAPLTATRRACRRCLMGTAYLFTEEAVADGAIGPVFQRQVLAAEATALLETAPGHTTRGVVSPFTDEFEQVKEQLRAEGVPSREAWEKLEDLNVGRLRIASKGLRREGDQLLSVGEQGQLAEGMFMAGQVAVLRDKVTTVAALHTTVTGGARDYYSARTDGLCADLGVEKVPVPEPEQAPEPLDVAIVGMACMFPGSPDLASFWATILDGADRVTEVPKERWDPELYYDPKAVGRDAGRGTPSKWGGFLPPIAFDPLRYGIPPAALGSIEPTQLLALESARRALVDAGYDRPGVDHERTSVVFGAEAGSDLSNAGVLRNTLPAYLGSLPPAFDEQLPRLTEDSFPGVLSNVIAGRIANRLDLGGVNYTVDAACASSLAALDAACKELVGGGSDLVLCGGADLHNGINDYLLFSSVHALSATGRSRTFDAEADGIALGEGVGCVVLKRLADAERDGDRVYAVIKGVGGASDGRALGLTAPRPEGQRRALERAYRNAGISPAKVGLVEAHGTGTVVGDRTELTTLTEVFREAGAAPGSCVLGSVKSQIGHTKCAAGLAGLIKTAMALHTGVRPPTLHLTKPNPGWEGTESPFAFHTAARAWPAAPGERVAGVSAFGFGGTNFHVVLTGYEQTIDPRHGRDEWPAELFVFRGADRAAAHRSIERLLKKATEADAKFEPWRLRDLALSVSRASDARGDRAWVAFVAADLEELAKHARRALAGEHDPIAGLYQTRDDEPWFGGRRRADELGQVRVPLPRPGQPAARDARRALRRLPRAPALSAARPRVGRTAAPAGRLRRGDPQGAGRADPRHPRRPAHARSRRARRRPPAAQRGAEPGRRRRPQLRRAHRPGQRRGARPGRAAGGQPGARAGDPGGGGRGPRRDGRRRREPERRPRRCWRRPGSPAPWCPRIRTRRRSWSSPGPPRPWTRPWPHCAPPTSARSGSGWPARSTVRSSPRPERPSRRCSAA